jgi:hypothetical protein
VQFRDENIQRKIIFSRPMQDWEVDVIFSFFDMYPLRVRQGDVDRICLEIISIVLMWCL